jgi:hypothetical protein
MVRRSDKFTVEWFLDGRRKKLDTDEHIPAGTRPTGTHVPPGPKASRLTPDP